MSSAGAVAGLFMVVDGSFFIANMAKVLDGGYVPLLLACAVYGLMWIWHRGAVAVHEKIASELTPTSTLVAMLESGKIARVPGSAVFLTRAKDGTPPVMWWHISHNRSLHELVLSLTLTVASTPRVRSDQRLSASYVGHGYWRAEVRYGFMELPDIPKLLAECKQLGVQIDLDDVTYYLGRDHRAAPGQSRAAAVAGDDFRRIEP